MSKETTTKKRKKRFGDRYEGRRLRTLSPMTYVAPYIMVNRSGASNLIRDSIVLDDLKYYIANKRHEGLKGFGAMYIFIAAYIRAVSQYPGINRFLSGQKIYARNKIQVVIDIKKKMELNAQNTTIKIDFDPRDTIYDVYNRFTEAFEKNRVEEEISSFDSAARMLHYIPGIFLKFTVWFLKLLDYFGLIPKFLINLSPFHGSLFITSMGSLGIPPIYHHLYDFGNIPIFLCIGNQRTELQLTKDGETEEKKLLDFTVVTDERICDGHYFATALKYIKECIKNPSVLDTPPENIIEDEE